MRVSSTRLGTTSDRDLHRIVRLYLARLEEEIRADAATEPQLPGARTGWKISVVQDPVIHDGRNLILKLGTFYEIIRPDGSTIFVATEEFTSAEAALRDAQVSFVQAAGGGGIANGLTGIASDYGGADAFADPLTRTMVSGASGGASFASRTKPVIGAQTSALQTVLAPLVAVSEALVYGAGAWGRWQAGMNYDLHTALGFDHFPTAHGWRKLPRETWQAAWGTAAQAPVRGLTLARSSFDDGALSDDEIRAGHDVWGTWHGVGLFVGELGMGASPEDLVSVSLKGALYGVGARAATRGSRALGVADNIFEDPLIPMPDFSSGFGIGDEAAAFAPYFPHDRLFLASGELNLSRAAARTLETRTYITRTVILDGIQRGHRVPDPKGVPGQYMYYARASLNNSEGRLEVLVHEPSGQIRHVLYRSD